MALATVASRVSLPVCVGSPLRNERSACVGSVLVGHPWPAGIPLYRVFSSLWMSSGGWFFALMLLGGKGIHLHALHVMGLPGNRFHPLVFICCRLVSSRLHRRFSCLFVSYLCKYLRPCCHHLCRLVGLIREMTNVFVTLA